MISIIPEGFNDFSCKGGACRHTCCQVWEIDIDEDTAAYYSQLPGKLGDDLRRAMVREKDGTWHFRLNPEGYCYLLDPDGLCRVIKRNRGEDALCDICTVHPRFFTYVYEYILCGTGLCCEKTCEILSALPGPLHFTQEETGESFTFPELLEEMGLEALPEDSLHFAPDLTLEELKRIIRDLGATEPIDAAWTRGPGGHPGKSPGRSGPVPGLYGKNVSGLFRPAVPVHFLPAAGSGRIIRHGAPGPVRPGQHPVHPAPGRPHPGILWKPPAAGPNRLNMIRRM